jgi:hypothetical protein
MTGGDGVNHVGSELPETHLGPARVVQRLGVVGIVYGVHASIALALAWPVARMVGDPTLAHPRGDAVLFEPGAMYLVEVLRLHQAPLTSAIEGMTLTVLFALYLGLYPLAALLHGLAQHEPKRPADLVAAAGRSFAPFSLLLGLSLVAIFVLWSFSLAVATLLETKLKLWLGLPGSDIAQVVLKVTTLLLTGVVAVLHDLARAAVVAENASALRGIARARGTFWAYPTRALGAWASRGLVGLVTVGLAAWAAGRIGVETDARLFAVTLLHQGVIFALVLVRADWLPSALRLVHRATSQ